MRTLALGLVCGSYLGTAGGGTEAVIALGKSAQPMASFLYDVGPT